MSARACPVWCNAHQGSDPVNGEDDMHQWVGAAGDPDGFGRAGGGVYITQGLRPDDEVTLTWHGESHETDGADARAFAAALAEAADMLDEIRRA